MNQYIKEISSDSAIKSFEITGNDMCVTVQIYTEETVHVEFEDVVAFHTPLWSTQDDIESLLMTDESKLLSKTIENLKRDEATDLNYKSFQFIVSDGSTRFEIVAKKLMVNRSVYE